MGPPPGCRPGPIPPPAPHDLRRTWTGDLLEAGVELATLQKMTGARLGLDVGRYDRRPDPRWDATAGSATEGRASIVATED